MPAKTTASKAAKKEYALLSLFEKFIQESKTGKRLQPNGKRFTAGTIQNYSSTLRLLRLFSEQKGFILRLRLWNKLSAREKQSEKVYWARFYRRFSDYLYNEQGHFDNYVGFCFKNIKVFMNYLQKHKSMDLGGVHRLFYVRKEEIAIFPLLPENLHYLIYNQGLEARLSERLREAKDFVVFGCTVALRFSDLVALKQPNLRRVGEATYLSVQSQKTGTHTMVKLPDYAVTILGKYSKGPKQWLLPRFNISNLNGYIKRLFEQAGFTQPVALSRERRGKRVVFRGDNGKAVRFCDVASTHTMRRTAISTMLCLGMKEQIIRRISGHSPKRQGLLSVYGMGTALPGYRGRGSTLALSLYRC